MAAYVDPDEPCIFCKIIAGEIPAAVIYQDEQFFAFLDNHPLFAGHVLLCPREHYLTFPDLPHQLVGPMFETGQMLTKAVEKGLKAEGTFMAINNRVSQTVPHLHLHIVPRRRTDGLKGFFWPRHKYESSEAQEAARAAIEHELKKLRQK
jgi:histidine triad (HIT) family protein